MTKHIEKYIKKKLEKSPLLSTIAQLIKYRNDAEYIALAQGLRNNPNIIELKQQFSRYDEHKTVCLIKAGSKADGFFACVRWALDGIYFCDTFGFIPYIVFDESSPYKDSSMPANVNPFMYYFNEPYEVDIDSVHYIKYNNRNRLFAEKLNGGVNYSVTREYIEIMGALMKKYLHFNSATLSRIGEEIGRRKIDESLLGVHIRGTDYKDNYKNHPKYIGPQEYYPLIDAAINQYGFKGIFLATDDKDILDEFVCHYGEGEVHYAINATRSSGLSGIHTAGAASPYKLGLDVVYDMCSLAKCGGIISGMSQVGLCARVYKKSTNESFLYDKIIDCGVNQTGKSFAIKG